MRTSPVPVLIILAALPGLARADAADLLALVQPTRNDAATAVRVDALGFAADDFTPAHSIARTWNAPPTPRDGPNRALGFARLETSASHGTWSVAVFRRYDALGSGTPDTVRFYHALAHPDDLLARDQRLGIDYRFTGFSADGLRLTRHFSPAPDQAHYAVSLNLLKAGALRMERATGIATTAGGVATVNGRRSLLYTGLDPTPTSQAHLNDFAPVTTGTPSAGWGVSVDLDARWQPRPDLHLSVAANDLLGRLHWQDVPEMVQDFNGTAWPLQFNQPQATARITGANHYRDVTLHLKPKVAAAAEWSVSPRWQADASLATVQGVVLPEAGLSWQATAGPRVRLSYETRFGSAGVGVRMGPFYAEVRSDRFNLNDAHSLGARAGLTLAF